MYLQWVMGELEAAGTERNRAVFRRHGMPEPLFGVPFAKLGELRKRIGVNHALALALWESGNSDARNLAPMVADASRMNEAALDAWAKDLRWYGQADQLAGLAARSPVEARVRARWVRSPDEWIARAGWCLVAHEALHAGDEPDAAFEGHIPVIERGIHSAPNRARDAMLGALIAIGARSDALERLALAAANRIGFVEVNHGETGCSTPDPIDSIPKARDHRRRREERDAAKRRRPPPPPGRRPRR
jgi:3-methyladenine DNA glycosylase AlkD